MARRPSSIDRMPPEIRDWIGRLTGQGRTLDEIIAHLRTLDVEAVPSRSALHRHLQKAEAVAEKMKRSRAVADVIVRRLGEGATDKVTQMNIELMHNVIFELASKVGDQDEDGQEMLLGPQEVMLVSKALDHLGKAAVGEVTRARSEIRLGTETDERSVNLGKAAAMKATEKAIREQQADGAPLDGAALLRQIREDVYGIRS